MKKYLLLLILILSIGNGAVCLAAEEQPADLNKVIKTYTSAIAADPNNAAAYVNSVIEDQAGKNSTAENYSYS
ncbi:hypothetical protein SCACP_06750 [Sporomusa carbonis]|uniref:hypothetical protein n=1 Tax=Sporomusa carbonis TaxID=3076075 RepID=UPI003A67A3D7